MSDGYREHTRSEYHKYSPNSRRKQLGPWSGQSSLAQGRVALQSEEQERFDFNVNDSMNDSCA